LQCGSTRSVAHGAIRRDDQALKDTLAEKLAALGSSRGLDKSLAVEFCERCSQVCDSGCRQEALRERVLTQALRYGVRV
jgi:hypothetical protein